MAFKFMPSELVFYFIVLNTLSFLMVFFFRQQMKRFSGKEYKMRRSLFSLKNILSGISFLGGLVAIGSLFFDPIFIQKTNPFITLTDWSEYLFLLALTGLIVSSTLVEQRAFKEKGPPLKKSIFENILALIIFFNLISILAISYSQEKGDDTLFQYSLIAYSFVFFACLIFAGKRSEGEFINDL